MNKNFFSFIILLLFLFFVFAFYRFFWGTSIKNISVENSFSSVSWFHEGDDYYLFLPKIMDYNQLSLSFSSLFSSSKISIYDSNHHFLYRAKNHSLYSLSDGTYFFKVSLCFSKTREYVVHVIQSDLPSMFLNTDGGRRSYQKILSDNIYHKVYYPGNIQVFDSNSSSFFSSVKKIRGRGNSTWLRSKKPFQLTFEDEVSLLGMKKSKKWILLSNHWDGSLARNYLWLTLAKKMEIDYSVDCSPVDLYINHEYVGSYLITNKVEVSSDSISIDEGYLFEIINQKYHDLELDHGYQVNIHYPDIHKMSLDMSNQVKDSALKYLNSIEKLLYDDSVSLDEINNYIDIDSFIKYYWVQEISENYDVNRGSNYLYVKNNKLYIGPVWDMDNTLNRSYHYADSNGQYILNDSELKLRTYENWYQALFQKEGFDDLIRNYYVEHVDLFRNLIVLLDDYQMLILRSARMNYIRWPYDRMRKEQQRPWLKEDIDFDSSCSLLRQSIMDRINYYQNYYFES